MRTRFFLFLSCLVLFSFLLSCLLLTSRSYLSLMLATGPTCENTDMSCSSVASKLTLPTNTTRSLSSLPRPLPAIFGGGENDRVTVEKSVKKRKGLSLSVCRPTEVGRCRGLQEDWQKNERRWSGERDLFLNSGTVRTAPRQGSACWDCSDGLGWPALFVSLFEKKKKTPLSLAAQVDHDPDCGLPGSACSRPVDVVGGRAGFLCPAASVCVQGHFFRRSDGGDAGGVRPESGTGLFCRPLAVWSRPDTGPPDNAVGGRQNGRFPLSVVPPRGAQEAHACRQAAQDPLQIPDLSRHEICLQAAAERVAQSRLFSGAAPQHCADSGDVGQDGAAAVVSGQSRRIVSGGTDERLSQRLAKRPRAVRDCGVVFPKGNSV